MHIYFFPAVPSMGSNFIRKLRSFVCIAFDVVTNAPVTVGGSFAITKCHCEYILLIELLKK